MANKKISDLTKVKNPQDTDLILFAQTDDGTIGTWSDLKAFIFQSLISYITTQPVGTISSNLIGIDNTGDTNNFTKLTPKSLADIILAQLAIPSYDEDLKDTDTIVYRPTTDPANTVAQAITVKQLKDYIATTLTPAFIDTSLVEDDDGKIGVNYSSDFRLLPAEEVEKGKFAIQFDPNSPFGRSSNGILIEIDTGTMEIIDSPDKTKKLLSAKSGGINDFASPNNTINGGISGKQLAADVRLGTTLKSEPQQNPDGSANSNFGQINVDITDDSGFQLDGDGKIQSAVDGDSIKLKKLSNNKTVFTTPALPKLLTSTSTATSLICDARQEFVFTQANSNFERAFDVGDRLISKVDVTIEPTNLANFIVFPDKQFPVRMITSNDPNQLVCFEGQIYIVNTPTLTLLGTQFIQGDILISKIRINSAPSGLTNFNIVRNAYDRYAQNQGFLTLDSEWENYGFGYTSAKWIKTGNIIHLQGLIKAKPSATSLIATLPTSLRPAEAFVCNSAVFSSDTVNKPNTARIDVQADGRLLYGFGGTPQTYLSLNGITYFLG